MNEVKTIKIISASLFFGILLTLSTNVYAQDPVKAASNVYKKVLLDNDQVRVLQVEFAPGGVAPWHWHPNHVIYALTGGKLEITDKDKPATVLDIKAGDTMYLPAVTHMAKNIGTTTVKLVVTELKPMKM
jgi:quercetin dioxygenase-like cupin family protein